MIVYGRRSISDPNLAAVIDELSLCRSVARDTLPPEPEDGQRAT
jgi:hypothetical protein